MIFDHRKLRENERTIFRQTLADYAEFDRLDFIIAMSLKRNGTSFKEFNERTIEKREEEVKVEVTSQSVMYCDSDKCEMPFLTKNC